MEKWIDVKVVLHFNRVYFLHLSYILRKTAKIHLIALLHFL
jgi:hypothetical protein